MDKTLFYYRKTELLPRSLRYLPKKKKKKKKNDKWSITWGGLSFKIRVFDKRQRADVAHAIRSTSDRTSYYGKSSYKMVNLFRVVSKPCYKNIAL